MTLLSTLPNEILSLITSHLDRPQDVLWLSLTNRRICDFVKLDGWKAFLRGRFGISGLDKEARRSVHGLTTLYRNWDRRGLIAKYLEPSLMTKSINTWQKQEWRGPRGQTMGYQPSIDSYEETLGKWLERREVLAWSAGTSIVLRTKETGNSALQKRAEGREHGPVSDSPSTVDAFGHRSSWWTYKIPDSFEGRDDITSLKLLRPHQGSSSCEELVFGTASGQLSRLSWDIEKEQTREQRYETTWRTIGAISLSSSSGPLLAATLGTLGGESALALYPTKLDESMPEFVEPLTQVAPMMPGARNGRIWSCSFLSDDKVAVGLGPSHKPIQVFNISSDGFLSEPLRTFSLESQTLGEDSTETTSRNTSVYPIVPLPSTAQGGSDAGNVFLSGGYDGLVRLHDLRSRRGFETIFWDPTNDSSIYSLAIHGLERVVAGVSMHST
jgi:WD40 repeat protein